MMKSGGGVAVMLSLYLASPVAGAVDLTLLAGLQANSNFENADTDKDIGVDDGPVFALAVDFPYRGRNTERLGFYLSHQATEFSAASELDDPQLGITQLQFTAMSLWPVGRWEPFLLLGVGAAYFAPESSELDSKVFISGQIAGGANLVITPQFLLRFGARWLPTFFNGSSAVFCDGSCDVAVKGSVFNQGVIDFGLQFRF